MDIERQTYQVEDVAKILGISRSQAYEAVKVGWIPSIRIGRRIVVPRLIVEKMLAAGGNLPKEVA